MRLHRFSSPLLSFGTLVSLSFALFLASYARLSKAVPALSVLLYGARLSSLAGAALFACAVLLLNIERSARRGRLASTLLAVVLLSPLVHSIAAHVASGDGLRARGFPEWLTTAVGVVALSLLVAIVWSYRFWARRRLLDTGLALAACAALLVGEAQLNRAQTQLATLLQLSAVFLATQLLQLWLRARPRAEGAVAVALACSIAGLGLAGAWLPVQVAAGRRRALVAESPVAYVEARLFGHARSPEAPRLDARACAALRRPAPFPPLALAREQRRNVVLISIDALRADYVEAQVNGAPLMPNLVAFTREASYAPRAQSAFPATLMSLTAAFTGYLPSDILLAPKPLVNVFKHVRPHLGAVEAVLPAGSYFARPHVQTYLLDGSEHTLLPGAAAQTEHAIARLRELRAEGKRHLMWIHYYEPHDPYRKVGGYDFGDSDMARYQSELAFVDAQLGTLLATLRDEGWYQDSLIVLLADHGESFGEHNHYFHHYLVYPWLVNVPLVWRTPDASSHRVSAPVHLMDIAPTVLHFLELTPSGAQRGRSLLGPMPELTRPLVSEEISISTRLMLQYRNEPARDEGELFRRLWRLENGPGYASKLAVRRGADYLVQHRASLATELYRWPADLNAERDLADSEPQPVAALEAEAERLRLSILQRAACDLER